MTQQTFSNGETGASVRSKINTNFTEVYSVAYPTVTAFSTSVGFASKAIMPRQQVGSALTFTATTTGAIPGMSVDVELVADGTNVPSFAAFKEWGGSAGYLNTTGMVNLCRFEFTGLDYIFSVNQLVSPVAAPRITSIDAATTQNTITITYNMTLNTGSTPAASAFTVANTGGVQSVTGVTVNSTTVVLVTSRTNTVGDVITVSYSPPTANGILSTTGEFSGGVSGYSCTLAGGGSAPSNTVAPALSTTSPTVGSVVSVTTGTWAGTPTSYTYQWIWADTSANISGATANSYTPVAGDVGHTLKCAVTAINAFGSTAANSNTSSATAAATDVFVRLTTIGSQVTEVVNGSGWDYTGSVSIYASINECGVSSVKIPSGQNGYLGYKLGNATDAYGPILGVTTSASNQQFAAFTCGIYRDTSTSASYLCVTNGSGSGAVDTNIAPAANDKIRLRRSGTTIIAEISKDNGSTWSATKTWTGVTAGDTYLHLQIPNGSSRTVIQPFGSSNVA